MFLHPRRVVCEECFTNWVFRYASLTHILRTFQFHLIYR